MPPKTIAIVTCSTRQSRLNPFITAYITTHLTSLVPSTRATITPLDLAAQSLPLFDEPTIPASLPAANPTPHYERAHTRAWSATVRRFDAFVFVTPQYNWSVPASLKNALDYLFHEWGGKPAAIVTYGSRGGGKAADHLRAILCGLRMRVLDVEVRLGTRGVVIAECEERGAVGGEVVEGWRGEGVEEKIGALVGEMMVALEVDAEQP